uniref:Uncharacterized protein n=1 Tax=Arundo donax TaxID=35708 RepID=A0A0A9BAJ2_ARUDO
MGIPRNIQQFLKKNQVYIWYIHVYKLCWVKFTISLLDVPVPVQNHQGQGPLGHSRLDWRGLRLQHRAFVPGLVLSLPN